MPMVSHGPRAFPAEMRAFGGWHFLRSLSICSKSKPGYSGEEPVSHDSTELSMLATTHD